MIAAVKGWHAAWAALLFFIPAAGSAADDPAGAGRELARKTAAFLGRSEPVTLGWRNTSSAPSTAFSEARASFEAALNEAGNRISDAAPVEARITLSQNQSQYLLVEEIRKRDERQVWISAWKRSESVGAAGPGLVIEKKLVWEQDDQMLDIAFPPGGMLVLSRSKLALFTGHNGDWHPEATAPLTPVKSWPRDARGRLRVSGGGFQAYLPGAMCSGTLEPSFSAQCRGADEPWVLESGSRAMLLANFTPGRNYFDGRVTTQTGAPKRVPPFYSAAAFEEQGRPLWLLGLLDGRTGVFDGALEPAGTVAATWGSDIAGVDTQCGGPAVLATRPGDGNTPDAIQAYFLVNRTPAAAGAAVDFSGPVTALWPSGGTAALAIVHDSATGKFQAFLLAVTCGP
jgi:hypothetical protein